VNIHVVETCAPLLAGRVLDFGCGRQPYRHIVEQAGGDYVPWDRKHLPGGSIGTVGELEPGGFDAVLSTQVIEYTDPREYLADANDQLRPGGHLVMTYPTSWPEIPGDLVRFTKLGMERQLEQAGFVVERHEIRAALPYEGFILAVGYGVVARA
jgi:SAM-dependent methyltransferase